MLARFRRAHPNCDLSLVLGACSDILEKLRRGEMDIVFAGPDADGGELLWEEPLVWTGTLDSSKAPVELVLMPAPCHYRQMAFAALTKARRPWKLAIEANSVQAVQSAIRAGLGASVLPWSAVLDDMPLIGKVLPKLPKTSVLSYMRPDLSHPYAQRFVDFLLAGIAPNGEERAAGTHRAQRYAHPGNRAANVKRLVKIQRESISRHKPERSDIIPRIPKPGISPSRRSSG